MTTLKKVNVLCTCDYKLLLLLFFFVKTHLKTSSFPASLFICIACFKPPVSRMHDTMTTTVVAAITRAKRTSVQITALIPPYTIQEIRWWIFAFSHYFYFTTEFEQLEASCYGHKIHKDIYGSKYLQVFLIY